MDVVFFRVDDVLRWDNIRQGFVLISGEVQNIRSRPWIQVPIWLWPSVPKEHLWAPVIIILREHSLNASWVNGHFHSFIIVSESVCQELFHNLKSFWSLFLFLLLELSLRQLNLVLSEEGVLVLLIVFNSARNRKEGLNNEGDLVVV